MADLKEKFDTKDENSSGVLLHEYLKFTMTENNTQDHCISYAKLVQDLAEQVPAIVPPCPVQHKIFVDSLHERFRILKTLERKTKSADLRALFLDVTSFARDEGIESKHSDMKLTLPTLHSPLLASVLTALFVTDTHQE